MEKIVNVDGVMVLYSHNKVNNATYCQFGIRTGAFAEKIEGTAHFLEHMLFYKTKNRNKDELLEEQNKLQINAFTGVDRMMITFKQSSSLIEEGFDVCSDMYFNGIYDPEDINKERQVIEQEVYRTESDKTRVGYLLHNSKLYNQKRLQISPCGTVDSIKKIDQKVLKEYQQQNYCKENFLVSICTDKSLGLVKKLVKKYILPKLIVNSNFVPKRTPEVFVNKDFSNYVKSDKSSHIVYLTYNTLPINNEKDVYAIAFLQKLLMYGRGRFYREFRIKNQLMYSTPKSSSFYNKNAIAYGVRFECSGANISTSLEKLAAAFKDLYNNGVTQQEFDYVKSQEKLIKDCYIPDPDDMPNMMSFDYTIFNKIITKKYDDKMFAAVTYDEVQNACKRLFNIPYIGITIIGDGKEKLPQLKELKNLFINNKKWQKNNNY